MRRGGREGRAKGEGGSPIRGAIAPGGRPDGCLLDAVDGSVGGGTGCVLALAGTGGVAIARSRSLSFSSVSARREAEWESDAAKGREGDWREEVDPPETVDPRSKVWARAKRA
jgi:hypothetical protein